MSQLTAVAVWRTTRELMVLLDRELGEPHDCYVNGSQVWMREDGPSDSVLEYRLHPVAGYERPGNTSTYDVFTTTALSCSDEHNAVDPSTLWDGLEVFAAYDDELEPVPLVEAATGVIGLAPDAAGLVDHQCIGNDWERSGGAISIVDALVAQLQTVFP